MPVYTHVCMCACAWVCAPGLPRMAGDGEPAMTDASFCDLQAGLGSRITSCLSLLLFFPMSPKGWNPARALPLPAPGMYQRWGSLCVPLRWPPESPTHLAVSLLTLYTEGILP
jgi:hypothetical protein